MFDGFQRLGVQTSQVRIHLVKVRKQRGWGVATFSCRRSGKGEKDKSLNG